MGEQAEHQADSRLVARVLASDGEAIDALVRRLGCIRRSLASLNLRMGRLLGREDLHDVSQDTLLALWSRLDSYNGQASIESWARGFCFNGFMNAVRKFRRHEEAGALASAARERATVPPGGSSADHLRECVHVGLTRLEELDARVVALKHFEELTFEEIGRRLRLSPNTAKTRYYRALGRLREILCGSLGDAPWSRSPVRGSGSPALAERRISRP